MRALEILKNICVNERVCKYLKKNGLLDFAIYMYEKSENDILERINIIEIFKELF